MQHAVVGPNGHMYASSLNTGFFINHICSHARMAVIIFNMCVYIIFLWLTRGIVIAAIISA